MLSSFCLNFGGRVILLDLEFLADILTFSFSTLNTSFYCFPASIFFKWGVSHSSYWCSLYVMSHLSLDAFKIFFLSLSFNNLTIMCLDIYPTLGVSYVSWMYTKAFHQIRRVVGLYFFKYFSATFSLSAHSGILITHMLVCLILSHRFLRLCSFFFNLLGFLLFKLNNFYWSIKFTDSFFYHLESVIGPLKWIFLFQLLYFSLQNFCLVSFYF